MQAIRGFSLLELLLVLVLIGIGTSLGVASVDRLAGRAQEQRVTDQLLQELRRLRNRAILSRNTVEADLDYEKGQLVSRPERLGQTLPILMEVPTGYHLTPASTVRAKQGRTDADGRITLRFYPDGSMDDARFTLTTPSGSEQLFSLNRLTGRIDRQLRSSTTG